jgi:hypothetical protein
MNGLRPSCATPRRSLQRPTNSGTAKPAAEFTIITAPINAGASLMSASSSGKYVVVTVRTSPAPTAATANTARYAKPRRRTNDRGTLGSCGMRRPAAIEAEARTSAERFGSAFDGVVTAPPP